MAATTQHSDALALLAYLVAKIQENPSFHMTYSDAATALKRNGATDGRHIGQVTSRIDAACFYAKVPFLAMHRVRETHGSKINPRSFQTDLWQAHTSALVVRAEAHIWKEEDFKNILWHLQRLGADAASLQWRRIERFGQKGVNQAIGLAVGV